MGAWFKLILAVISLIGGLLLLVFCLEYYSIANYKFFGVRAENARREIFESSQSYIEGKSQELAKYKLEYDLAKDSTDKEILKNTILHNYADFDESTLPNHLQSFLKDIRK